MRDLSAFYLFFSTSLIKSIIRSRMLDSIYHMTSRLLGNLIYAVKHYNFVIMYATVLWMSYPFPKIDFIAWP